MLQNHLPPENPKAGGEILHPEIGNIGGQFIITEISQPTTERGLGFTAASADNQIKIDRFS